MSTTQVAIEILYKSVENAKKEVQSLKQDLDRLKQERVELQIDALQAMQKLHDYRDALRDARDRAQELRDVLRETGDQNVARALGEVEREIRLITNAEQEARRESDIATENLKRNATEQAQARINVARATDEQKKAQEQYTSAVKENEKEEERQRSIREQNHRAYNAMWEEEARAAERAAERQQEAFEAFNRELEETISIAERVSGVFSAIGAVSGFTAEFAGAVGNAFSGMSGLFETDIAKYATASLTHQLTQKLVGNASSVVSRYDILNTFVPYMELAGVSGSTAQTLLDRINTSILGLPIGLDEAAQRFRRYNMYIGDAQAAANLTIGLQSLITAGGAGDSYKTQAYNMIERMLATGTLTNIRQWQALLVGLGVSQRFIEEELGIEHGTLLEGIRAGTIEVDQFLAAIERLGTGTTRAAYEMQDALNIYKSTIESWLSNIEYAVTRGNVAVLNSLNSTLQAVTGKGITDYLSDWRETENNIFGWASNYISNNPEQLATIIGYVQSLFEAISRFSASDVIQWGVKYLGDLVSMIRTFLDSIPEGRMEKFVAFATTMSGTLGKIFDAAGKAPWMMAVFDRFEDFDWDMFAQDLASAARSMADILSSILKMVSDPVMSKILAYGIIFGRPVQSLMNGLGSAVTTGAGFYTQYKLWQYLRGGSTMGGYTTGDIAAIDGGTPASLFWSGAVGGTLASAGIVAGAAVPIAIAGNAAYQSMIRRRAANYAGSTADARAELAALQDALIASYDENGYAGTTTQDIIDRMEMLRYYIEQHPNSLTGSEKKKTETVRRKQIAFSLSGNADKFEWLEAAGKYDYAWTAEATEATAEASLDLVSALYAANKAYQDLYTSARESLEGQISLWEKIELNKPHYVSSGEGNSKSIMESNTKTVERYADAVTYLSNYVAEHPEAAGYIGQMVGTMDIADLATIENLVKYIKAEKDLPIDSWNALAEAIDRASQALARWQELTQTREYTHDEATSIIQEIFGDDPEVLATFNSMWGELEKTTEDGMKVFEKTIYEWLVKTGKITQEEVDKINSTFDNLGVDPNILYATGASMMDALRRGLVSAGDKAIWEARRIAYNILHAFDGVTYGWNPGQDEMDAYMSGWRGLASGGLVYAANGKLIRFEPRGTDTVPAMLTPGEFVMRKQAVDTFGAAFMKSINDLNIGAAFDRLINAKLSNPRGYVSNTYNNRDDHSTHIQNIKTNNPYFASRRAGRFVRAMA